MADALLCLVADSYAGWKSRLVEMNLEAFFCNGPRVTKLHTVIPTGSVEFLLDHVEV